MKAVVFTKDNELKLVNDYKKPIPKRGEALVRVTLAGICNTDYEITKGYMGYDGILGHEAVGIVEEVNGEDKSLVGKRVVPEISYGCKDPNCPWCAEKLYRHCPDRHTLGIFKKMVSLQNISQCQQKYYLKYLKMFRIAKPYLLNLLQQL